MKNLSSRAKSKKRKTGERKRIATACHPIFHKEKVAEVSESWKLLF